MQSQQQTKGEVIAELRGKTDSLSIKDISSSGVKIENNDIGQITGKYQANFMETISIHMKPDGTSEWEGKGVQMAGQDMVVTTSKGHGHQTGPGTIAFEGDVHFMTQSPRLSWLNNTKGWIDGTANQAEQSFTAKVYAKKRSEEHTSELQSLRHLVCRLLLEKKKKTTSYETLRHNSQKLRKNTK